MARVSDTSGPRNQDEHEQRSNRHRQFSILASIAAMLVTVLLAACSDQTALNTGPSPDAMGGDLKPLTCGTAGYIVQIASGGTEQTYKARVEEIRKVGQLPSGAHYFTKDGDCNIYGSTADLWVLYAGPFATPRESCPVRLQSPPDAIIKGLRQDDRQERSQCLCESSVDGLPLYESLKGSDAPWTGELQQALLSMGYPVDQSLMGVYSDRTQHIVAKFQRAVSLTPSGEVDTDTWQRLKAITCA